MTWRKWKKKYINERGIEASFYAVRGLTTLDDTEIVQIIKEMTVVKHYHAQDH